jgi:hypothetical protein
MRSNTCTGCCVRCKGCDGRGDWICLIQDYSFLLPLLNWFRGLQQHNLTLLIRCSALTKRVRELDLE